MVLLSGILAHGPDRTRCFVTVREDSPFRQSTGLVPAWVGVEYMAQCVAAHEGLLARAKGDPIKIGFLIGSRAINFHEAGFRAGQSLDVTAQHLWGQERLGAFACSVADAESGTVLVEGTLNVFVPDDVESFIRREPGRSPTPW